MGLHEIGCVVVCTEFVWLGIRTGEHGNEPSVSIKYYKIFE
jgi:hypothetical protein